MQILDFFQCSDPETWIAKIRQGDWQAAKYLAQLLENGTFLSIIGSGTVYMLTDGPELVSFVTLTHQDCIDDKSLFPWIGFFYTFPQYRGHRYGGLLLEHAAAQAAAAGHRQVYIATDHIGLYDKYGFTYLENRTDIYGLNSWIYMKRI